jgi:hypothetical protein
MKTLLFSLFICIIFSAQAQYRLAFTNADSSKTVIIKQKDLARLSYKGYMSQPQEAEGNVSSITDSSISLAPRKKFLQKKLTGKPYLSVILQALGYILSSGLLRKLYMLWQVWALQAL